MGVATMLDIGQDIGIQCDDRLNYELSPPERRIYEVDRAYE